MNRRKQLYKSPLLVSPPPWKDVYRKKCFERLRERRASLIEKFRFASGSSSPSKMMMMESTSKSKIVSDVMEIEWNAINQHRRFPSLSMASSFSATSDGRTDFEEEQMRETLREIQDELQSEDELQLNEFLSLDSKELASKVEMLLEETVICPICQKRKLNEGPIGGTLHPQTPTTPTSVFTPTRAPMFTLTPSVTPSKMVKVVWCECGVKITGEFGCSLDQIRSALHHTLREHEKNCASAVSFTHTEDNLRTNVLVTCSSCEWMTFLL